MSIFLDTSVLVAAVNPRDRQRAQASALLEKVADGAWGPAFTSDLVLVEGLTYLRSRVKHEATEQTLQELVVGSPNARPCVEPVLKVHGARFRASLALFNETFQAGLSFTDCASLVLMREKGIPRIATFDGGFRGFALVEDGRDAGR